MKVWGDCVTCNLMFLRSFSCVSSEKFGLAGEPLQLEGVGIHSCRLRQYPRL